MLYPLARHFMPCESGLSPPVNIPRCYFFCGSFLLVMLHVCVVLSCLFLAALWSPAGKGLTSWLSCVLSFLVFCHFPKFVLVHIRIKGEVCAVKLV